jgi:hypothetical protein
LIVKLLFFFKDVLKPVNLDYEVSRQEGRFFPFRKELLHRQLDLLFSSLNFMGPQLHEIFKLSSVIHAFLLSLLELLFVYSPFCD